MPLPCPENHDPASIFSKEGSENRYLLILDQPISSIELVRQLWSSCFVRICADGGANRLYGLLGDDNARGNFVRLLSMLCLFVIRIVDV